MFINDVHILIYILIGILGLGVGYFIEYVNWKLSKHEKIFSLESMKIFFKEGKTNYFLMCTISILYIAILRNSRNTRYNKISSIFNINTLINIFIYDRL